MSSAPRAEAATVPLGGVPVPSRAQRKPSTTPTIGFRAYSVRQCSGQQAGGIDDRGREQPELHQEWHQVLDVAEADVQGREPDACRQGREQRKEHQGRNPGQGSRARVETVVPGNPQQQAEGQPEIRKASQNASQG